MTPRLRPPMTDCPGQIVIQAMMTMILQVMTGLMVKVKVMDKEGSGVACSYF